MTRQAHVSIWEEFRKNAIFLPVVVFIVFLILCAVFPIFGYMSHTCDGKDYCYSWNTGFRAWPSDTLDMKLCLSILFGASLWGAIMDGKARWLQRIIAFRPASDITSPEHLRARLCAAALALGATILAVTLITEWDMFDPGNVYRTKVFNTALSDGTTNLREILAFTFTPHLLVGLFAWSSLRKPSGKEGCFPGVIILFVILLRAASGASMAMWEIGGFPVANILLTLGLGIPALLFCLAIARTLRRNVQLGNISKSTLRNLLMLWGTGTLLIYPFRIGRLNVEFFLYSLTASALLLWPYLSWLHRFQEERESAPSEKAVLPLEKSAKRSTTGRVLVIAVLLFLAWIRWPAEFAFDTKMRSEGYPVTLEELDTFYRQVPPAQNTALAYLKAVSLKEKLDTEDNSRRKGDVLIEGYGKLNEDASIPAKVWEATYSYNKEAEKEITPMLIEIAKTPYANSRYPINLGEGIFVELPHLSPLHTLSRTLAINAFVASVEKRPHDAVKSILANFPLAESLKDAPCITSQLVRCKILAVGSDALENLINRTEISKNDLMALQTAFETALPAVNEEMIMERAFFGNQIIYIKAQKCRIADFNPIRTTKISAFSELIRDIAQIDLYLNLVHHQTFIVKPKSLSELHQILNRKSEDYLPFLQSYTWLFLLNGSLFEMGNIIQALENDIIVRTQLNIASLGIALERYRITYGHFPESLDALVPEFIAEVPEDPYHQGLRI
jgi:hypothetical protein